MLGFGGLGSGLPGVGTTGSGGGAAGGVVVVAELFALEAGAAAAASVGEDVAALVALERDRLDRLVCDVDWL